MKINNKFILLVVTVILVAAAITFTVIMTGRNKGLWEEAKTFCINAENTDSCYIDFAIKNSAPEVCELLSAATDDMCMSDVYKAVKNQEICGRISHSGVRENCYKWFKR